MNKKILVFLGVIISLGAIFAIVYASITLNKQEEIQKSYLVELTKTLL